MIESQESTAKPEHRVRQHLNLQIDEYDALIRRWIPGYERMLFEAAQAVAAVHPRLVLDLGSGTGALAQAILRHAQVEAVELVDVDPEMLDQARVRLAGQADRARFSLRSFDLPFAECDAMAASLSLHHIRTIEAKRDLFARAFEALRPGGVLVNADCCMPSDQDPESVEERNALFRVWVDHQVSNDVPEAEAWQHFDDWSEEDTYLPLDVELAALRSVGFDAERIWNDGPIGVVVATKPKPVA